jgi:hypothetical protein
MCVAWITTISPDRASGELADTYAQIAAARGGVAQVHQVQSHNPRAMAAHFELYKSIVFQGSSLTRAQREGLAVTVSLTVAYFSSLWIRMASWG